MNESEKRAVDIHVATLEARVKELETEVANLSRDLDQRNEKITNIESALLWKVKLDTDCPPGVECTRDFNLPFYIESEKAKCRACMESEGRP
jgi:hypothetical protein